MVYNGFISAEGMIAYQLGFLAKVIFPDKKLSFWGDTHAECIYIKPSEKGDGLSGITTDGRRLHLVDPIEESLVKHWGLSAGYWEVIKNNSKQTQIARLDDKATNDWKFPNWRKVIPAEEAVYKTVFQGFSFKSKVLKKNHAELARFFRDLPEATAINLEYLEDLGVTEWDVEWYGQNKAVKFTAGDCVAVIMPMQM